MKIDVKRPSTAEIKAKLGVQKYGRAHAYLTSTCYKYMSFFVPGGVKSHLNQNVDIKVDSVIYQSPDAHYHWRGKKYVDPKYKKGAFYSPDYGFWSRPGITKIPTDEDLKYHVPGTGPYWDKCMWNSRKNEVIKEVQKYIDRGCK